LGKKDKLNATEVRNIFATVVKTIKNGKFTEISIVLPDELLAFVEELGQAVEMGNYYAAKYKSGKEREELENKQIKKITFINEKLDKKIQEMLKRGMAIGQAVNLVRDLVNGPPNIVSIDAMADLAKDVATENKYKIQILDKPKLEKLKMGALLGVNRGSASGAKLVIMEHLPNGKKEKPTIIVGKGIIFDTGGYNLKPSMAMDGMNMDMAGAAVVLGTFMLLKKLNVKRNVIGVFPLTDNMVSDNAQRPTEVVTTFSGKTVEIGNTDAEGRLVLADAISYALKNYDAASVIDLATLTGACRAALGERYAGLLGNNKALKQKLRKAGAATDEALWPLPLHPDHTKSMKSKIADLNNIDGTGLAGASTAAAFIAEFVEKKPWAHLDIAGVASVKSPKRCDVPGATGFGVRLLLKYLES
jgi:leucyl aminopeptidase